MNKMRIEKCFCTLLLIVLVTMPCVSLAIESFTLPGEIKSLNDIRALPDEVTDFKNPGWDGSYERISNNEYLYPKFFYYKGKYYDLKLEGNIDKPKNLRYAPPIPGTVEEIKITILESETGNIAKLKNFYYGFLDVDSFEKFTFDGNIVDYLYKPKDTGNSDVIYSTSDGKTMVSATSYTLNDTLDSVYSNKPLAMYIKSDVLEENQMVFSHENSNYGVGNFYLTFFLLKERFDVNYRTDGNGELSSLSSEAVITEEFPTGGDNYIVNQDRPFKYWTCDKTVGLSDGTLITSGDAITAEQVKLVIVQENLTFTAHFEVPVESEPEPLIEQEPEPEPAPVLATEPVQEVIPQVQDPVTVETYEEVYQNEYESEYDDEEDEDEEVIEPHKSHKKSNTVKTGDDKNIAIYSFILAVSAILLRIVRKAL